MYFGGIKQKEIFEKIASIGLGLLLTITSATPSSIYIFAEEQIDPPAEEQVENNPSTGGEEEPVEEEVPVEEDENSGGDANIETGDAEATIDSTNIANTNQIETNPEKPAEEPPSIIEENNTSTSTPPIEEETATTTPPILELENEETTTTPEILNESATTTATTTLNVNIDLENEADIEVEAEAEAITGENESEAKKGGDAEIKTGDAFSNVNVLNIANTNIIDSYGFILLMNSLFDDAGTIDFRSLIEPLNFNNNYESQNSGCSTGLCGGSGETEIDIENESDIENGIIVRSITGENEAESEGGNASVETGDAYAGANVTNLANTNIVNSTYMLLSLNNFGTFSSDLVLPGKDFFSGMFSNIGKTGSDLGLEIENDADIDNEIEVEANTGENETEASTGDASTETGDAVAGANVTDVTNSNFFNTNSFYILLRVYGNWTGNIFGLPPGINWQETENGIEIFGTEVEGSSTKSSGGGLLGNLNLTSENDADIDNEIEVYALTGKNKVSGGEASVATGNAYAGANVINVANTNIIGTNWILAIVNIFGDWNGNLAFGRPDLWIGGEIEPLVADYERPGPNSRIDYKFTVVNRGDADATDVVLRHKPDKPYIYFVEEGMEYGADGSLEMNIGNIPAGDHKEIILKARAENIMPTGDILVSSKTEVSSYETDADYGDNKELLSILFHVPTGGFLVPGPKNNEEDQNLLFNNQDPEFMILKTSSVSTTTASSTISYEIVVKNYGGYSPDAFVIDTLENEDGEFISEQSWELGPVYADEEIKITYQNTFGQNAEAGFYTNTATIVGKNYNDEIFKDSAEVKVYVENIKEEKIVNSEVGPRPKQKPKDKYGITLRPPMCTAYGCFYYGNDLDRELISQRRTLIAGAFGAGFDLGDQSLRFFLLAAVMYAISRREEEKKGMSLFF